MTLFNAVWGKTLGSLGGKWAIADKGLGIFIYLDENVILDFYKLWQVLNHFT